MILDQAAAVLKKDFLTALRYRNGFVLNILSAVIQLGTFLYLSRAVGSEFRPEGMPYFLFLIAGSGFYTFLVAGAHSLLRTIQEAQQTGTLEVLMSTSTPAPRLLMLSAISAFAGDFAQFALFVGAGLLLTSAVPHLNFVPCILVFVLSTMIAVAVGVFAAGLQIAIHKGSTVLWLLGSGAWLLSGTLFPVSALPAPLRILSVLLPFTHSLTGIRLALFGTATGTLWREIQLLAWFTVFLVPLALTFFSLSIRNARRSGTLSFY